METVVLKKIQVTNFRNLSNDIVEFSDKINCIFGQNGGGKTNLLEAIYYLSNKKSFKKNTGFPQLLSMDCEKPEIIFNSLIHLNNEDSTLTSKLMPTTNEWYLNNKKIKKVEGFNSVFINPFDSFLFHSSATFRRTWVDNYLSILDKEYKKTLSNYNKLLRMRNSLLKKKPNDYLGQFSSTTKQFAEYSYYLVHRREIFFEEIRSYCGKTFKEIFSEDHDLKIVQESKFLSKNSTEIENYFIENQQKDSIIGHIHYGVHRDDYHFIFDGINSFEYCSLGQQKMSYLSLIFAYIELFRYKYSLYPIVLIDDVSGELDSVRWHNLISYLKRKDFQVMITTANENFKEELELIEDSKKVYVKSGELSMI